MIKSKYTKPFGPTEIDLTGPQGNAFVLLGYAQSCGKSLGLSKEEINNICDDMRSGDYEHLLEVFEENFGEYFVMYR